MSTLGSAKSYRGRVFIGQLGSRGKGFSSTPPTSGNFFVDPATKRTTINVTSTNGKTLLPPVVDGPSTAGAGKQEEKPGGTKSSGEGKPQQRFLKQGVSPFYIRTDDGYLFENWWQAGKVFPPFLVKPLQATAIGASVTGDGTETKSKAAAEEPPQVIDEWTTFSKTICQSKAPIRHPGAVEKYKPCLKGHKPVLGRYNGVFYEYVASRFLYAEVYSGILQKDPVSQHALQWFSGLLEKGHDLFLLDFDGPPSAEYPNGVEVNQVNYDLFGKYQGFRFGHGWVLAGLLAKVDLLKPFTEVVLASNPGLGTSLAAIVEAAKSGGVPVRSEFCAGPPKGVGECLTALPGGKKTAAGAAVEKTNTSGGSDKQEDAAPENAAPSDAPTGSFPAKKAGPVKLAGKKKNKAELEVEVEDDAEDESPPRKVAKKEAGTTASTNQEVRVRTAANDF